MTEDEFRADLLAAVASRAVESLLVEQSGMSLPRRLGGTVAAVSRGNPTSTSYLSIRSNRTTTASVSVPDCNKEVERPIGIIGRPSIHLELSAAMTRESFDA